MTVARDMLQSRRQAARLRIIMGTLLLLLTPLAAIPASAQSSMGHDEFVKLCAPCHGESGRGDGPAGVELKIPPADLTKIAAQNGGVFPTLRVFDTIAGLNMLRAHGSREMPVWGDVFVGEAVGNSTSLTEARAAAQVAEDRIRHLVDYIATLQTK